MARGYVLGRIAFNVEGSSSITSALESFCNHLWSGKDIQAVPLTDSWRMPNDRKASRIKIVIQNASREREPTSVNHLSFPTQTPRKCLSTLHRIDPSASSADQQSATHSLALLTLDQVKVQSVPGCSLHGRTCPKRCIIDHYSITIHVVKCCEHTKCHPRSSKCIQVTMHHIMDAWTTNMRKAIDMARVKSRQQIRASQFTISRVLVAMSWSQSIRKAKKLKGFAGSSSV